MADATTSAGLQRVLPPAALRLKIPPESGAHAEPAARQLSADEMYEAFSEIWRLFRPTSTRPAVIAFLDTGVDVDALAAAGALWTNPGEVPGDGIDNDGNGYVDDVHGYDVERRGATTSNEEKEEKSRRRRR